MNPSNNGTYTGVVCKPPIFIRNKQGVDFQARFVLQVRRAYKNKEGKYTYDFLPMRLSGSENRLKIARRLKPKDVVVVSGSTTTQAYQVSGETHYEMFIDVDSISFAPKNFAQVEETKKTEKQWNLPFD